MKVWRRFKEAVNGCALTMISARVYIKEARRGNPRSDELRPVLWGLTTWGSASKPPLHFVPICVSSTVTHFKEYWQEEESKSGEK